MINTVSITTLKQNTADVIGKVKSTGQPVVVMQRSEPAAVLVDPDYYQILEEALEEREDLKAIEKRKNEPTVSLDNYLKKRFKLSSADIKKLQDEGSIDF